MGKSKHGKIEGPFLPLLNTTMDCPAWKAMSHGAKWLYVELKRKSNSGPRAYLSFRDASKALGNGPHKIREWFAELEHYGFIRLHTAGCLGIDGKGKSPHWRLTEKGQTSKASPNGLVEPPPNDFLKWDGVLFDPKPYRRGSRKWDYEKQNPDVDGEHTPMSTTTTPPMSTTTTPKPESDVDDEHITGKEGDVDDEHISSLTTTVVSPGCATPPSLPSDSPLEERTIVGPSEVKTNVVHLDDRLAALEAAEKRRKLP